MIVNVMSVKMQSIVSIPVNMILYNSGVAQLLLAISDDPLTTMKKALLHGRLLVFWQ